jgi:uncharacterized sulfatase
MKGKLTGLLNRYLLIVLAFLPTVFLVRFAEFLSLNYLHTVPGNTWIMELSGYLLDNLVFFSFALLLVVPFFLLCLLSRKAASVLTIIIFMVYTLISLSLVKYFTMTLVPLDQVLFYFTPNEIFRIVVSSTRIDLPGLISFIIVFLTPLVIYFFLRNLRFSGIILLMYPIILIISPVLMILITPGKVNYENDFEYFARCSKIEYLVSKVALYKTAHLVISKDDKSFGTVVKRFHYENKEFSYINPRYPLLRIDATPDVLGEYFTFGKERPNLVFIIVESLSSSFCGDHPYYGSFMPFLDSLADQSLFWKNFLCTSERTFNVLPAMFGSLPYSKETFRYYSSPLHFSMIRYLKENGYSINFFYGGDPTLGGYNRFLENERTDYILRYFGKGYNDELAQKRLFEWGYFDGDLFRRSLEVIDSLNGSPRLDIYLTLTTHAPFITPDPGHYRQLFDKYINQSNLAPNLKRIISLDRNIFTTILYTDEALRSFFNNYRKRKDFNNTIFFITGDHAMPELNYSYLNLLERFHVPFIIYSPMLKKPKQFQSVSSHLDITPSVLAMLKNQGFITLRPVCHWLGKGIDVTEEFENNHAVSFIYNSRVQAEYIHGEFFISSGRLFRLLPDFKLYPVNNVVMKEKMSKELEDYLYITNDIADRNSLIPDELFLSESYLEVPYLSAKPEILNKVSTNEKFISLVKGHKIGDDFQFISLDLSVVVKNKSGDTLNEPKLVLSIQDNKFKDCAWFQFHMNPVTQKDGVKRMVLKKYIDVSKVQDIKSKNLKIYLLNTDQVELYLDDLRLEMKEYKLVR